jgi:signal transduction histidine kinase
MARRSPRPRSEHTILLVDDQQDTLVSVGNLLEREGHRVLTAESGAQALEVLKTEDVHLLIVDYFMPRMTGAELVRDIRAFDPYVQIILQTGYSGERPPRVMLTELDIQGYHDKTDDPERLLLWVQVALKTFRLIATLRERERLQAELVANCSHEFRTPLNIVLGYTDLLLAGDAGDLPPHAVQPVRSIDEAARDLTHLVSDFLQYARIDAGAVDVTNEWLETRQLVREVGRLAGLLLEDGPVTFKTDVDPAVFRLFTDGSKLRSILRNLVINAAKFTTAGTITLRVARRDETVRIEVEDTGPGISPADHERIFEPFRQLDGSSTRKHGGVGLGLALARKQARILGGDLELRSEAGVGSTFALVLPGSAAEIHDTAGQGRLAAGL